MAKRKSSNYVRSTSQKIKKVKRTQTYRNLSIFLVFFVALIIYYVATDNEPYTPEYSADQNAQGFYYYHLVGSEDYYYQANNLIGNSLKDELHDIISDNVTLKTYNETSHILEDTDQSIEDITKIWTIYDGSIINAIWDSGDTWNKEHVWPNSRLGVERVESYQRNIASDLHNLRGATPSINSSRSDRFYSDGEGTYGITEDGGFYPGDEHKGDVARILFYMAVMYQDTLTLTNDLQLLLDETDHYTEEGARMGRLSLLLQWHKEDPVSQFERNRNEVIFGYQGNRNPFIDKPEYVHLIWENKTIGDLAEPEVDPLVMFQSTIDKKKVGLLSV
jgi:endonuclease I